MSNIFLTAFTAIGVTDVIVQSALTNVIRYNFDYKYVLLNF